MEMLLDTLAAVTDASRVGIDAMSFGIAVTHHQVLIKL